MFLVSLNRPKRPVGLCFVAVIARDTRWGPKALLADCLDQGLGFTAEGAKSFISWVTNKPTKKATVAFEVVGGTSHVGSLIMRATSKGSGTLANKRQPAPTGTHIIPPASRPDVGAGAAYQLRGHRVGILQAMKIGDKDTCWKGCTVIQGCFTSEEKANHALPMTTMRTAR